MKNSIATGKNRGLKGYTPATNIVSYIVMVFIVIISLFPIIWLVISSFKTNIEILESAFSWPQTPSWTGYAQAIEISKIQYRYITSLIVSCSATSLALLVFSMAGYVLGRFRFKGRGLIFGVLISSMLVPSEAMIQPIYQMAFILNIYDTKFILILVYTAFAMATCLFLLRNSFTDIPKELEEAAYLEGASFNRTFLSVMLPLAKPALMSAAVLTFINCWNELLYAMLLTSRESNRTLPLMVKYFTSSFSFNYPAMFAALVMYIAPSVFIYIVLQEQVMSSMVTGAIKG